MPKARVLPVPVRAWPIMSVPESAIGIAIDWMGKGWTMPTWARASTIGPSTPRSAKVCFASSVTAASSASSAAASDSSVGAMSFSRSFSRSVRVLVSRSASSRPPSCTSVLSVCVVFSVLPVWSLRVSRTSQHDASVVAVPGPAADGVGPTPLVLSLAVWYHTAPH